MPEGLLHSLTCFAKRRRVSDVLHSGISPGRRNTEPGAKVSKANQPRKFSALFFTADLGIRNSPPPILLY